MFKSLVIIFLLLSGTFAESYAKQEDQHLIAKIENYLKENHPALKNFRKEIYTNKHIWNYWGDKTAVSLSIGTFESTSLASDNFNKVLMIFPIRPKAKTHDYGDEAVVFQSEGSKGGSIIFRKSKTVVRISAIPLSTGESIARYIADQISEKQ